MPCWNRALRDLEGVISLQKRATPAKHQLLACPHLATSFSTEGPSKSIGREQLPQLGGVALSARWEFEGLTPVRYARTCAARAPLRTDARDRRFGRTVLGSSGREELMEVSERRLRYPSQARARVGADAAADTTPSLLQPPKMRYWRYTR